LLKPPRDHRMELKGLHRSRAANLAHPGN
jgi:hypothetical protein